MEKKLDIYVNGDLHTRFDAGVSIPGLQRRQLDELDFKMDDGVPLGGEHVALPDRMQRVQFVCGLLQRALYRDQEEAIRGFCTYLVSRAPELLAVHVVARGNTTEVELVFAPGYQADAG